MFYIFNTKAMAIVDSFYLPYPSMWPSLSADGTRLYIPVATSHKTAVIDVTTRQLIIELQTSGYLAVASGNDKYLALFGDSLDVFDGHTLQKLYTVPQEFAGGWFSTNEERLYCPSFEGNVVKVDLGTQPIQVNTIEYPGYAVTGCIPSADERYLFSLTFNGQTTTGYFEIYQFSKDSVIYSHDLLTWFGWMEISRTGSIVAFAESSPSGYPEEPPSSNTVTIFDVGTMSMRVIIPTFGIDPSLPEGLSVDQFVLTPDGKWLVGSGEGPSRLDFGLVIIDMENFRTAKLIKCAQYKVLSAVTCRKIPK